MQMGVGKGSKSGGVAAAPECHFCGNDAECTCRRSKGFSEE